MKARFVLGAWAVAVTGCSDLPAIDEGVCGNLVVDVGEDCDGFSSLGDEARCGAPESENACAYVCSVDPVDPVACPAGWGCGQDGRCRRPSGAVARAPGSPWRFRVQDFAIGDVDGDGNADLVGAGETNISLRLGTPTGEFPVDVDIRTRRANGPAAFDDVDGDGRMDVVLPIFSGVFVMLGQPEGTLLPVAYQPFELGNELGNDVLLVPVESEAEQLNTEILGVFANVMSFLTSADVAVPLPDGHIASDLAGRVPVANLGTSPLDVRNEFALAFAGEDRVWVYSSAGDGGTLRPDLAGVQIVRVPAGTSVRHGAQFADVNGDGALDLMISVRAARDLVAVAYNDGAGTLDATARVETVFDDAGATPWPLASADLNGDGKADYVTADAVWIADLGVVNPGQPPVGLQPTAIRVTEEPWSGAAIGDFNGDGLADAAVAIDSVEGVDVYYGTRLGLFNKFHIGTDAPPFSLRAGDFDGDFIDDIAFAMDGGEIDQDQLAVAFGATSGGPSEPISMGRLDHIQQVEPMHQLFDVESIDVISDVLVLSSSFPDRESLSVAILQGNSDRRLLSPFALQVTDGDKQGTDVPSGVLIGNFAEMADGGGNDFRDLVAVASPELSAADGAAGGDPVVPTKFHLWLVPGDGPEASLSAANAVFTPVSREQDGFDVRCSQWVAGDFDGDGWDEIVGIDGAFRCYGRGSSPAPNLLAVATDGAMSQPSYAQSAPSLGYTAPHRLVIDDLDGDGDNDLVVMYRGEAKLADVTGSGDPPQNAGIVAFWNIAGALDMAGVSAVNLPAAALFDIDVMDLDDDAIPELVVLASDAVWAIPLDPSTAQYGEPFKLATQFGTGEMSVGDVNGDGVDDIAWTEGPEVQVFLGVPAAPLGSEGVIATEGTSDEEVQP